MQTQQYTLTNRLMGDPRPDREIQSAKHMERTKWKPSGLAAAIPCPHQAAESRIKSVLQAIRSGCVQAATIAAELGISRDMASAYLKRSKDAELIVVAEQINYKSGGRTYIYTLTDKGRDYLAAAEQTC